MADFYVMKNEVVKGEFADYSEARAFAASLGEGANLVVNGGILTGSLYADGLAHSFTESSMLYGTGSNNAFVFGGSAEGNTSGNTSLTFNSTVAFNAWVFGGNSRGEHTGNAEITLNGAVFDGIRSAVYGGGNEADFVGDINITLVDSFLVKLYAGGRTGSVTGAVSISLENSELYDSIYGAGYKSDLRGDLAVSLKNSSIGGNVVIGGERSGVVYGVSTVGMAGAYIGGDLVGAGNTELLVTGYNQIGGSVTGVSSLQIDAVSDPGACLEVMDGLTVDDVVIRIAGDARNGDYAFLLGVDSNLLNVTIVADGETLFDKALYRGANEVLAISETVTWSLTYSDGALVMSVVDSAMAETPFHLEEVSAGKTALSSYYDTLDAAAAAANSSRMAVTRLLCNGDAEGDFVLNANESIFNNAVITGSLQTVDENSLRGGTAAIQFNNSSVTDDVYGGALDGGRSTVVLCGGTIGGGLYGAGTQGAGSVSMAINDGSVGAALTDKGGAVATVVGGGMNDDADVSGDVFLQFVGGYVRGGVYGGGLTAGADVDGSVYIQIQNGYFGGVEETRDGIVYYQSNIYGGGKAANLVRGDVSITMANGVVLGSVYGAGEAGRVDGSVTISMSGGQVRYNLYGAGATGHAGVGGDVIILIYDGILGGVNLDENGNEVFDSGNIYGGSRSRNWVDGDVIVTVYGGSIYGSIYGGSHFGTDHITIEGGTIRGGLYGSCDGGKGVYITVNDGQIGEGIADAGGAVPVICGTGLTYGNLNGDVAIALNGGTIRGGIYAAGAVDGVGINGNTSITIGECFIGGIGTSNGEVVYYESNVYGGGKGVNIISGNSTISMAGGTVLGSIFGGGEAGRVEGNVDIAVTGGWVRGDIYGGGDTGFAGVGGSVTIAITGGTFGGLMEINGVGTYDRGNIYGSGRGRNYIDEKVEISIADGLIYGSVYGGSRFDENNISVSGGAIYGSVFGSLKGAGSDTAIVVENGVIGAANQEAAAGVIYGGAAQDDSLAMGDVSVSILGGSVCGSIYGGGKGVGSVVNSSSVVISDGQINGSVCGSGENGGVANDVTITISGGIISGNVAGSGAVEAASVGGNVTITVSGGVIGGMICGSGSAGAVGGNAGILLDNVTVGGVYGDTAGIVAGDAVLTVAGSVTVAGAAADFDRINLAVGSFLTAAQISAGSYQVAIDRAEGNGLYQLAAGVVITDAVTVAVECGGLVLGEVTLAADALTGSFVADGNTYTVSAVGGNLSVKIEDGVTPSPFDVNGDVFADLVLVHEAGYTGAWTIQSDMMPVWLDLSMLGGDFTVLGVGCLSTDNVASDIILYSAEHNMVGAWITGADGAVTGWETIAAFDGVVEVLGVADFNADACVDLLLSINGEYGTFLNGGAAWNLLGAADGFAAECIGDFNGDGCDDLLLTGTAGAKVWFVDAAQSVVENAVTGLAGTVCGAGDFDGNGREEVLVNVDNMLKIASFDEAFQVVWTETGINAADCTVEQLADFNADGLCDIVIRTSGGDIGAMVAANGVYEWHYFGSAGSEWTTSMTGL